VQLLTNSAVDSGVGASKRGMHVRQKRRSVRVGRRAASKAQSTRMGRWKASVQSVTSARKKRYCRPSGCACRTTAFVMPS
jgi:hypothetical protein